jgi:hypothetical protein
MTGLAPCQVILTVASQRATLDMSKKMFVFFRVLSGRGNKLPRGVASCSGMKYRNCTRNDRQLINATFCYFRVDKRRGSM